MFTIGGRRAAEIGRIGLSESEATSFVLPRAERSDLDSGRERSIKMERQAASRRRAVAHPRVWNDERRSTRALRNGSPADIDSQARDALSLGRESRVEAAWKPRGSRVEVARTLHSRSKLKFTARRAAR